MANNDSPYVEPSNARDADGLDRIRRMIERERTKIGEFRQRSGGTCWSGIALSGGGIRSAIFCLGALQALADRGVLKHFDYMSSVSGGGYIASALQWLWHQDPNSGTSKENFPFGTSRELESGDVAKDKRLAYLRTHGRYLAPGEGLTIWSMTAVVIRTLFLNLAVWIPLGALAIWGLILLFQFPEQLLSDEGLGKIPNPLAPIPAAWAGARGCGCWPVESFFVGCFAASFLSMLFFGVWAIAFSLDSRISPTNNKDAGYTHTSLSALISVSAGVAAYFGWQKWVLPAFIASEQRVVDPFLLGATVLLTIVAVVFAFVFILQLRGAEAAANYKWRRSFEIWGGAALPWITIVFTLGTVPIVPYLLLNHGGAVAGTAAAAAAALSGIVTAVAGNGALSQNQPPSDTKRWCLMVGSAVFIYTLVLFAYVVAQLVVAPAVLVGNSPFWQNALRALVFAAAGLAIILGWRTNVNYVGLHRFYRDRLMEAFMPDADCVEKNVVGRSSAADTLSIAALWTKPSPDGAKREIPYPIINTNAVLINDSNRELAWRGGDSFCVSPHWVGSAATGWEETWRYIAKHGPLSLASAMAASGAALNANAAYIGAGVTRDRLLSIVLMILNVRLGMWVGRPSKEEGKSRPSVPNHLNPGFRYGLLLSGYKSNSEFMELSDGGHFDNLGVYELVRRKAKFILVLDGEQDSATAMPALYSVAQRIREDFGAKLDLDGRLDDMVVADGSGFPGGARYMKSPYFAAPVVYADEKEPGVLVYIKLSFAKSVGFGARGYRAQNPDFPHQSTANQFFVPQQVEAYREVGYVNMTTALDELGMNGSPIKAAAALTQWANRAR